MRRVARGGDQEKIRPSRLPDALRVGIPEELHRGQGSRRTAERTRVRPRARRGRRARLRPVERAPFPRAREARASFRAGRARERRRSRGSGRRSRAPPRCHVFEIDEDRVSPQDEAGRAVGKSVIQWSPTAPVSAKPSAFVTELFIRRASACLFLSRQVKMTARRVGSAWIRRASHDLSARLVCFPSGADEPAKSAVRVAVRSGSVPNGVTRPGTGTAVPPEAVQAAPLRIVAGSLPRRSEERPGASASTASPPVAPENRSCRRDSCRRSRRRTTPPRIAGGVEVRPPESSPRPRVDGGLGAWSPRGRARRSGAPGA